TKTAAAKAPKAKTSKPAPKPAPIVQASIVIDAESGRVLHESDADTITYPASLTKMMTLYLTFDALKAGKITLDTPLVISKHAIPQPPTKMFLRLKDHMTIEQGILSLVIRSANDVAVAMAETLAPTEEEFALKMTQKARKLGMTNTTFRNASG